MTSHRVTQGAAVAFVIGALLRIQATSDDDHGTADFGPSWLAFGIAGALALAGVVLWLIERSKAPVTSELERLADLHQQGKLTDEEFAAAKRRLLG